MTEPICDGVVGESVSSLHQVRLQDVLVQHVAEMFQAEVADTQRGKFELSEYRLNMSFLDEKTEVYLVSLSNECTGGIWNAPTF